MKDHPGVTSGVCRRSLLKSVPMIAGIITAAAIPKSRVEILEQGGHLCPLERPAAFNHVVSEFLGTLLFD